ncbi:cytochrome c oxidase assembly protein [Arthrobacter cryoconiti]|uniref:Cytochrome c oxidase assembly protein n=1 Tax=Arthrobacter cryoconiti TaxID=748907 RepID=A0ABV8R5B7_9MICC|nr:cytochrome c oxidase assembly protein [Arthrobacter cryoconiti]MCC9069379.1 cytochrome c oxidase assembly protein [Arthrobacter cryoconiti]
MPPWDVLAGSWTLNWAAVCLLVPAAILYVRGLVRAHQRGVRWRVWRSVSFYALGLGSFAVLSFGFPGVYSHDLRWVFTLKITGYLFVVPLLVGLGKPLTLARATLDPAGVARLEAFLGHRLMRLLGNTIVAALLGLILFTVFLTPLFYPLRTSPVADVVLTVAVPMMGLLMTVPIIEEGAQAAVNALIVVEFIFVFIELVADAIPGIMMRMVPQVFDGATVGLLNHPGWMPNALRDQQLAGDLLWFVAEIVDLPLLILMFVRFSRSDKREARSFDGLSDDQLAELTREHLANRRDYDGLSVTEPAVSSGHPRHGSSSLGGREPVR